MNYIRRVYYDIRTGTVLCAYSMSGHIEPFSPEKDAQVRNLSNWGVLEWIERDPAIESAFAPHDEDGNPRIVNIHVDISGETPELVFSYEPVPQTEPGETEDMAAALALLGVTPKETEE